MVRFGRVEGFVRQVEAGLGQLQLTVTLEEKQSLRIVRDERVTAALPGGGPEDLAWVADQYTQETIAVHLAEEGWEAIGVSESADSADDNLSYSPRYSVRNLW